MNAHKTKTGGLSLDRADSSVTKPCDLHVYKVPSELWRDAFNNVLNNAVTETISVGIIRVPAELHLVNIRDEITQQLGIHSGEMVPKDYVFLRSVGRSLTALRAKQEHQLKAKHFVPPVAYAPELYILETTPEMKEALASSDTSSQSPSISRRTSPSHRSYPNTYHSSNCGRSDNQHGDDMTALSSDDDYSRRNKENYNSRRSEENYNKVHRKSKENQSHVLKYSSNMENGGRYTNRDPQESRGNRHHQQQDPRSYQHGDIDEIVYEERLDRENRRIEADLYNRGRFWSEEEFSQTNYLKREMEDRRLRLKEDIGHKKFKEVSDEV